MEFRSLLSQQKFVVMLEFGLSPVKRKFLNVSLYYNIVFI